MKVSARLIELSLIAYAEDNGLCPDCGCMLDMHDNLCPVCDYDLLSMEWGIE